MLDARIVSRVPFLEIDAIVNSCEPTLVFPQQAFQSESQFWRGNFSRITGAHGRKRMSKCNPGFQTIHLAIKFNAFRIEIVPWQIGKRVTAGWKKSLVSEIVKREA